MKSKLIITLIAVAQMLFLSNFLFAHCDTMDGPVAKDAMESFKLNNVNIVLKWVMPQYEQEIKDAFVLTMKVRSAGPDARNLAEKYFIETLIRVHRSGEGVAYTGVKPAGTQIDEKILAADKSIETGNLSPLEGLVSEEKTPELRKKFDEVMSLKNFDPNDVVAGRKYVEAYVKFFHFAEGEELCNYSRNETTKKCHGQNDTNRCVYEETTKTESCNHKK